MKKKTPLRGSKTQAAVKKPAPKNRLSKQVFPVVAIGSSSGGLEAASLLFKKLSSTTGMAFIYVQHLSPDHKSLLTPILSKITKMKVQEIEDMEEMAPDNVYIIPNDKGIEVTDGHIKLIPRSEAGSAVSIDILFSSLAETHKENVIGVILSGNAHDGTKGLKAIKKAGGITFAQDGSAHAASMPESAVASGAVDYILSPEKIALELNRLGKNGFVKGFLKRTLQEPYTENKTVISDSDPDLRAILNILHAEIHVDFSLYKIATVKRRINHRMLQCGIKTIQEYAKFLHKKNKEVELLYKDLLINITNFFRDTETFQYLKTTFLPTLLKSKAPAETLRVWIPACSTGEEAYTIAMLIAELQAKKIKKIPVQIFATDLSEQAIREARLGEYSENDVKPVGKSYRERFFIKTGNSYRIIKEIRDMCVFAPHNILNDPPFSRIDFISCRNLLIYFDTAAQKKALSAMSFALNDGGSLLLGKSETVGTSSQFFNQLNSKFKLYTRKKSTGIRKAPELALRFTAKPLPEKHAERGSDKKIILTSSELDRAIDTTLLRLYMPACVIINKSMEIIKFRGSTAFYLSHPSGNASLNILKMTRPECAFELRNAIHEVIKTNTAVFKSGIQLNSDSKDQLLQSMSLEVRPLAIEWGEPLYLIVFAMQEIEKLDEERAGVKSIRLIENKRTKKQIEELHKASAEMITVIESQDKAYEELQAANEEIISASEEFQTLNEELETSKEEIEATNEELLTTNQELQMRNEQLAESYNFSEAVAEIMHEPMLILDKTLHIKSANKAFYKKFHIIQTGTEGTLLYELENGQWDMPGLRKLLENIIQKNTHFYDHEITYTFPESGKKTMLLNARRITQKTQNEQLILLTFTDTTKIIKQKKSDNKELEGIIRERTKALEQSLKATKEKNAFLIKANKELETFTFISSHDLQEPLRKISIFSDILMEDENEQLSQTGKENLKKVQTTVTGMQLLIKDLLMYTSIKEDKSAFEKADLDTILHAVMDEYKELLAEKHGEIKTDKISNAGIVGFQFRQLMQNLISNSLKFTHPKRYPRITIKSDITQGRLIKHKDILPSVDYCHICFSDNGMGFDPQYKEQIFEVFQRLNKRTEYSGTGMGLAICKRIVENHQGVITATGRPGKGAQFDIYLPAS